MARRPPIQPGSYDDEMAARIAQSPLSPGAMSRASEDLDALARIRSMVNDRRPQPEPEPPKERRKPFRATHVFQPAGLDAWDPKVHPGSQPIAPGTPVKRIAQVGSGRMAFHWIQDREGNQMSVWKSSLQPKGTRKRQEES